MKNFIFLFTLYLFCLSTNANAQIDSSKIHKIEYFFDADPGFGNGTMININPAVKTINSFNFNTNIVGLNRGLHTLFIRGLDSGYRWGITNATMFYKETSVASNIPNIISAEYFFDNDPSFGNATPISVAAGQNVNFAVNPAINTLSTGLHQLFIRTKDATGNYSLSTPQLFYKEKIISNTTPNINTAEYYFDIDPGFGNATPATVSAGQNVSFSFNPAINNLSIGLHQLFIRAKDVNGNWSISTPQLFYNERIITNPTPNIIAAEYFFDNDPGFGNANAAIVSAGQNINFSINPTIGLLKAGLHTLFVRTKDANGNWSLSTPQTFYNEKLANNLIPNIIAAEYFFDNDPGFGNANAAPVSAGQNISFGINTSINVLTTGLHQLFVRAKDANGNWSLSTPQLFYKEKAIGFGVPYIIAAEYFFDNDPGFGKAIQAPNFTASSTLNLPITGNIDTLKTGLHQLFVRMKDTAGNWSISTPQLFYKERIINNLIPNIIAAEYFFDTDPGFGNANTATVSANQTVNFPITGNIASLSTGLHQLFVRTKDANGNWSLSTPQVFYKERIINNPIPNIVAAEYYFDVDPGFGNATAFNVSPNAQTINQNFTSAIGGLKRGLHQLFIRTKDANGIWSHTTPSLFFKETNFPTSPNKDLITLEWFWNTDPGFGNANKLNLSANNAGQISNFVFNVPVLTGFSGTKQNLFIRVLDDWSHTSVKTIDFSNIVLPVTMLEFSAKAQQQDVALTWSTAQEINSNYFDVEHSTDGIHFSKIGIKQAVGNSIVQSNYNFLHTTPIVGINYYRLNQVDKDGKSTYSGIATVMFTGGKGNIVTYPNPVSDKLYINIPSINNGQVQMQLIDMKGAIVLNTNTGSFKNELNLSTFAGGSYRLLIKDNNGKIIFQQQILKQ